MNKENANKMIMLNKRTNGLRTPELLEYKRFKEVYLR